MTPGRPGAAGAWATQLHLQVTVNGDCEPAGAEYTAAEPPAPQDLPGTTGWAGRKQPKPTPLCLGCSTLLGTTGRTETPTDYAGVDRSTLTTRPRSGVLLHGPTPHTTRWDDDSDDSWPVGGCWSMGNAAATAGAAGPSTVTASPLEQSTAGYALGVTVPGYVWCTKPHILPPTVAGEELSRRAHTSGARGARPAVGRCMRGAVATRHENALGSLRSRLAGC